jgi:hypothetical protein
LSLFEQVTRGDYVLADARRGAGTIRRNPMSESINKAAANLNAIEKAAPAEKNTVRGALNWLAQTGISSITRRQWLAIRQKAASQIDPNAVEVMWVYSDVLAYHSGITGTPGREIYCRSRDGDEWVRFEDLPLLIKTDLAKKHPVIGLSFTG